MVCCCKARLSWQDGLLEQGCSVYSGQEAEQETVLVRDIPSRGSIRDHL